MKGIFYFIKYLKLKKIKKKATKRGGMKRRTEKFQRDIEDIYPKSIASKEKTLSVKPPLKRIKRAKITAERLSRIMINLGFLYTGICSRIVFFVLSER
ncbi:MAG: hypothetical protein J7K63_03550 [Candidatus Marinimicrobia bacterium]|nr:hypothetical protein [Candidatus Neomarinimicrobiota bacterium]